MYLVVECNIILVFSCNGCCNVGEVKVLFINIFVDLFVFSLVMVVILVIDSSGLVGVFI